MYYDVKNFIWLVNDVSICVWSVGLYVRAQSLTVKIVREQVSNFSFDRVTRTRVLPKSVGITNPAQELKNKMGCTSELWHVLFPLFC